MNLDYYDDALERELLRIQRLIADEIEIFFAPERRRAEVARYARMSEQAKAMLLPEEKRRLETLRRKLAREM